MKQSREARKETDKTPKSFEVISKIVNTAKLIVLFLRAA